MERGEAEQFEIFWLNIKKPAKLILLIPSCRTRLYEKGEGDREKYSVWVALLFDIYVCVSVALIQFKT